MLSLRVYLQAFTDVHARIGTRRRRVLPWVLSWLFDSAWQSGLRIRHLDLSGTPEIQNYNVGVCLQCSEYSAALQSICLSGCEEISMGAVVTVALHATFLVVADISSMRRLLDAAQAASQLIKNCLLLEVLDMSSNCVSPRGMFDFLRSVGSGSRLKQLKLDDLGVQDVPCENNDDYRCFWLQLQNSTVTHISLSHTAIKKREIFYLVRWNPLLAELRKDDFFPRTASPEHPTVINCAGLLASEAMRNLEHDVKLRPNRGNARFHNPVHLDGSTTFLGAIAANVQLESSGWVAVGHGGEEDGDDGGGAHMGELASTTIAVL